ncbi:MAG: class I SAM-dependent methyltransferase [Proteobacteria bacterium]|nr:class I SAM-dependent methyltransferase [Pseudomonadota bacterium]
MKHVEEAYLDLLLAWNKKHNIIGRSPARELLEESRDAIISLAKTNTLTETVVDIGAGSGIMGAPWLLSELSPDLPPLKSRRLVFVEPDRKSAAFLSLLRASLPLFAQQSSLLDCRLEDVRRETIGAKELVCFSRAFSPAKNLGPLYAASELRNDPLFVFLKPGGLLKMGSVD